jgi:hypothetical protein
MPRLTPFARLLIVLAIIGALFGGYQLLVNQGIIGKPNVAQNPDKPVITDPSANPATKEKTENPVTPEENTNERTAFSYTPPAPENGKLKGVVELGASGFNSFIIKMDAQKRWKLEKSEFGNSLVMENMASDDDIRTGLKKYIAGMLDYGVGGKDIHFVVSSGAVKAESTIKITRVLKALGYFVNTVTAEQEGIYGLKCVLPQSYDSQAFVVDIGSGNTKISWNESGKLKSEESFGAKYFQNKTEDNVVYDEVKTKAMKIPEANRKTCFIIGGVPFEMAKKVRQGKERYTVLKAPDGYQFEKAKDKAGLNIYKAVADATGCREFVFDWDANFTIGFLLGLP